HRSAQLVIVLLTKGVLFLGTIAYRTPLCKSKRGELKDTYPDDILASVMKVCLLACVIAAWFFLRSCLVVHYFVLLDLAVIEKTNLNTTEVGDMVIGSVLGAGSQRASECMMATFYAGFPKTVLVRTVNRQCSSGLQAVADVDAAIKAGCYDIVIAVGLESMTANPMAWDGSINPRVKTMAQAQDCLLPMGITLENVSQRFGVTRKEHDQAAVC
ncbi:3-ketoacyl-CoA thiolase 2, peroxisomal, partial [Tanacetum coccineum]